MRLFRELKHAGLVAGCCLLLHVTAGSCLAAGDSPWMVRVRALGIMPDDSSSQISVIGGEAEVDSAIAPDLNFTYFFTDNIAAELTLTYAEHDVSAEKPAVGNVDLGALDLLPPTLTAQYHFMPNKTFRPYVGALGTVVTTNVDVDPWLIGVGIGYRF